MPRVQFGRYQRRVGASLPQPTRCLRLSAGGLFVVSLFQVTFRFRSADPASHPATTSEPGEGVTYVNLSPRNRVLAATNVIVKTPGAASPKGRLSPSSGLAVIESPTAAIDTGSGSFESARLRTRRRFPAVVLSAVERTPVEVIDSIIGQALSLATIRRAHEACPSECR